MGNSEFYSDECEEKEMVDDQQPVSKGNSIPLNDHDGIISYLTQSGYNVVVKASSNWNETTLPDNVLRYDQSHWNSLNEPNSWISFTFDVKVMLESYLLRAWIYGGSFLQNWRLEGFSDDGRWNPIDQRVNQNVLSGPSKEAEFLCSCYETFRSFRFVHLGKNSSSNEQVYYCFHMSFVEFSGQVFE